MTQILTKNSLILTSHFKTPRMPIQTEEFTIANEHPRVDVNSATTDQTDGLNSKKKNL